MAVKFRSKGCLLGLSLLFCAATNAQVTFPSTSVGPEPSDELNGPPILFGQAVATDGNIALVGVPLFGTDPDGFGGQGEIAVYTTADSGVTWTRTGSIIDPNATTGEAMGVTIAFKGKWLITGSNSAEHVFEKKGRAPNETWIEKSVIPTQFNSTSVLSPAAIAFDGELLAVENSNSEIWIYRIRHDGKGQLLDKLVAPTTTCNFGTSVAIEGDTVVVGCPQGAGGYPPITAPGLAYVYTRHDGDHWVLEQELNGTASGGDFGYSVAIHHKTVLIGAPYADSVIGLGGSYALSGGATYVYRHERGTWTQTQTLEPVGLIGEPGYSGFGWSLALNGEYVVIGAPGGSSIAEPENDGSSAIYKWSDNQFQFVAPVPGAGGISTAISNRTAILGTVKDLFVFGDFEYATIIDLAGATTTGPH